jgi:hypothetical protein
MTDNTLPTTFPTYFVSEEKRYMTNEARLLLVRAANDLKPIATWPEADFDKAIETALWQAATAMRRLREAKDGLQPKLTIKLADEPDKAA